MRLPIDWIDLFRRVSHQHDRIALHFAHVPFGKIDRDFTSLSRSDALLKPLVTLTGSESQKAN